MKRTLLSMIVASCILFSCGTTSSTTSTDTTQSGTFTTSSALQTQFGTQYPGATNVVWNRYDVTTVPNDWDLVGWTTLTPDDYAATFDMNGNRYYAYYDANGNWIGSTYAMTNYSSLPAGINATLQSKYSGYTIDKAHMEMWKDQTAYEVKLVNGDSKIKVLFDTNGNVIKEKLK